MTRWLAIPVAALIAVAAGVVSWTTAPTTPTEAGAPTEFTLSIDCDVSTGGIQLSCNPSAGAFSVDIVATNNAGGTGSVQIGAFGFNVETGQGQLNPTVVACDPSGLDCNPDFNQAAVTGAGWACSPPAPDEDVNADPSVADSQLGCFNGSVDGPNLADGASIVLGRVNYTASDGVTTMVFRNDTNLYDGGFGELGSCNETISVPMTCPTTNVQVGASSATNTPTNTPTNTVVVPTNTPCVVGQTCATPTSLAYVTVTPTPDPSTATPAPAGTTAPGGTPGAPPPPPPPPPPGGGTAPGSGGTITLPDTGSDGGSDASMWMIALAAVAAVGTAGLAGGLWFSTAAARRQGED